MARRRSSRRRALVHPCEAIVLIAAVSVRVGTRRRSHRSARIGGAPGQCPFELFSLPLGKPAESSASAPTWPRAVKHERRGARNPLGQ